MIKIAPSVLAADLLNRERAVRRVVDAGADWIHVDVMDAHFVPNLSYGPALVEKLHERFPDIPLDVHLMMDNPQYYIDTFCRVGASCLTIHTEINADVSDCLRRIRARGVMAGLAIKPGTPVEMIREMLPLVDLVLVMTVEPGFGGQKFNAGMMAKLTELRKMGYVGLIESDGGLSADNLPAMRAHGLDVAVMGTAMFSTQTPKEDMERIHMM